MRVVVLATLLLLTPSAGATTMRVAPLGELVHSAEVTLVGRALSRESFWQEGRILTRVRVAVEETWLGSADAEIEVITLGGVVGDIGQRVDGSPSIPEGSRVVLLLAADAERRYFPIALWQGVFYIAGPGPTAALRRSVAAARLVGPIANEVLPSSLDALKAAVLEAARAR